jgi:hypothetical protein
MQTVFLPGLGYCFTYFAQHETSREDDNDLHVFSTTPSRSAWPTASCLADPPLGEPGLSRRTLLAVVLVPTTSIR